MSTAVPLVFVLYDGIEHSIFESQVLTPLLKRLALDKTLHVHLISFETISLQESTLKRLNNAHPRLHWKTLLRGPFLGTLSIYKAAYQLRKIFKKFSSYTLMARGPLAGIIATHAITEKCQQYTLQARGLLAEEYRYTHKNAHGIFYWICSIRYKQLLHYESRAYNPEFNYPVPFSIEVVSSALQNYLIKTFHVSSSLFITTEWDTPKLINPAVKTEFRKKYRELLELDNTVTVYVYNGSAKPWQCPQETIDYFKKILQENNNSFLLILTTEPKPFKKLCKKSDLPQNVYKILQVSYHSLLPYLCAGDKGLLFREADIVNWVSRPTKYLEYKAAGLTIVHNNTIAHLAQDG